MNKTKAIIEINGRSYDAATGTVLNTPKDHAKKGVVINDFAAPAARSSAPPKTPKTTPAPALARPAREAAPNVKSRIQKSTTLRRSALKKPSSPRRPVAERVRKKVDRSQLVSRFAPVKAASKLPKEEKDPELVEQAKQLQTANAVRIQRQAEAHVKPAISSRAVKEHLLKQSLDKAPLESPPHVYHAGRMTRRARFTSVAATSLALILLGGYLTYINLPNLSIRVAAANAGIDASLPRYQPGGYRIHGPIAYSDGQVVVNYQQNGGNQNYSLLQKNSDWDPQATLDNYVKPQSHNDYQIHSSQGLTVYTFNNKAAWVNGGILHIIDGSAPLSGQQVEQIAVSM